MDTSSGRPSKILKDTGDNGAAVPLTATLRVVAPLLVCVIFPEEVPSVARLKRTKIGVAGTVPPDGDNVRLDAKPVPLLSEIWKSAGAVIVMASVKLLPETV